MYERMTICPACSGEMRPFFVARDHTRPDHDQQFWSMRCACGFGRLSGFSADQIPDFYPAAYYTHGVEIRRAPETLLDRLLAHLAWRMDRGVPLDPAEVAGRSLCDIGCGDGFMMSAFSAAGFLVVGIEPDERARHEAKKYGDVFAGTAECPPQAIFGRTFDVVLMSHSLEHCTDPVAALTFSKSILAPGGTVVVEVPNHDALGYLRCGVAWPFTDIPRHLNFFTTKSLVAIGRRAGLSAKSVFYCGYTRQFQREWRDQHRSLCAFYQYEAVSPWRLLFSTVFAEDAMKYDSVRMHFCSA